MVIRPIHDKEQGLNFVEDDEGWLMVFSFTLFVLRSMDQKANAWFWNVENLCGASACMLGTVQGCEGTRRNVAYIGVN